MKGKLGRGHHFRSSSPVFHGPLSSHPYRAQQRHPRLRGEGRRQSNMKIKKLGRTGLKVSEMCLGTMTFGHQCDEKTSFAILDKAVEHGVTFIDTADVYPVPPSVETAGRTEEIIGKWLKGKRDRFVLA